MNAYIYRAALWCEDCIADVKKRLIAEGVLVTGALKGCDPDDEHTFDSDDFPKGPCSDGGGEADCPQHCDGCHCHLENPLTSHGCEYVAQALLEYNGDAEVLATWAEFYADALDIGNNEWRDAAKEAMKQAAQVIDDEYSGVNDDEAVKMRALVTRLRILGKL